MPGTAWGQRCVVLVQLREGSRLSSRAGNLHQASGEMGRVKDPAVVAPCGPAGISGHIADRHRRASIDPDFFQLAVGEKADPLSVRGKERVESVGGIGKLDDRGILQLSQKQAAVGRPVLKACEHQVLAVAGKLQHRVLVGFQSNVLWDGDRQVQE